MKKKIELTSCVGSDTLCYFWDCDNTIDDSVMGYGYLRQILRLDFGLLLYEAETEGGYRYDSCKIAENTWQSTANNLVIPDGLVCDLEFHCYDTDAVETITGIPTEDLTQLDDEQNNRWFRGSVLSIKIVGLADGWSY